MRLLRRHLLSALAAPFVFSLGALTGMMMMNQLAKRFADLVGKDLPWSVIAEVLGLSIPFIVALTLPMAVLVSVLYAFSQLGSDNEITAMRAGGISVLQMLRPVLAAGLVLAITNFFFVDQVLPRTNARLRNLQTDIGRKKPAFQMREQAINDLPPYFISAGRIFPGSGRLRDVVIYDLSLMDGWRVIYADSGFMTFETNLTDLSFKLYQGRVHEFKAADPSQVQQTQFVRNVIKVRNVQNLLERNVTNFEKGDREMTTCEMMDQVTISRRALTRATATRTDLVTQDLRSLLRLTPVVPGGAVPARGDSGTAAHCRHWKRIENLIGRLLLPETAQAQPMPLRAAIELALGRARTAAGQDTAKPKQDTAKPKQDSARIQPDTSRSTARPHQDSTPVPPVPAAQTPIQVTPPPASAPSAVVTTLTSPADALSAKEQEASARRRVNEYTVEIHKKYSISVACFTFVLIGVALALRFPRGGMGLVIGGGLAIFALFYVSLNNGESLADRGVLPPVLAMWFPNIVVVVIGVGGLLRVNREFGSTRGGDLAELVDSLRGLFRRRKRRPA